MNKAEKAVFTKRNGAKIENIRDEQEEEDPQMEGGLPEGEDENEDNPASLLALEPKHETDAINDQEEQVKSESGDMITQGQRLEENEELWKILEGQRKLILQLKVQLNTLTILAVGTLRDRVPRGSDSDEFSFNTRPVSDVYSTRGNLRDTRSNLQAPDSLIPLPRFSSFKREAKILSGSQKPINSESAFDLRDRHNGPGVIQSNLTQNNKTSTYLTLTSIVLSNLDKLAQINLTPTTKYNSSSVAHSDYESLGVTPHSYKSSPFKVSREKGLTEKTLNVATTQAAVHATVIEAETLEPQHIMKSVEKKQDIKDIEEESKGLKDDNLIPSEELVVKHSDDLGDEGDAANHTAEIKSNVGDEVVDNMEIDGAEDKSTRSLQHSEEVRHKVSVSEILSSKVLSVTVVLSKGSDAQVNATEIGTSSSTSKKQVRAPRGLFVFEISLDENGTTLLKTTKCFADILLFDISIRNNAALEETLKKWPDFELPNKKLFYTHTQTKITLKQDSISVYLSSAIKIFKDTNSKIISEFFENNVVWVAPFIEASVPVNPVAFNEGIIISGNLLRLTRTLRVKKPKFYTLNRQGILEGYNNSQNANSVNEDSKGALYFSVKIKYSDMLPLTDDVVEKIKTGKWDIGIESLYSSGSSSMVNQSSKTQELVKNAQSGCGFVLTEYKKQAFFTKNSARSLNYFIPKNMILHRGVFFTATTAERDTWVEVCRTAISELRPGVIKEINDDEIPSVQVVKPEDSKEIVTLSLPEKNKLTFTESSASSLDKLKPSGDKQQISPASSWQNSKTKLLSPELMDKSGPPISHPAELKPLSRGEAPTQFSNTDAPITHLKPLVLSSTLNNNSNSTTTTTTSPLKDSNLPKHTSAPLAQASQTHKKVRKESPVTQFPQKTSLETKPHRNSRLPQPLHKSRSNESTTDSPTRKKITQRKTTQDKTTVRDQPSIDTISADDVDPYKTYGEEHTASDHDLARHPGYTSTREDLQKVINESTSLKEYDTQIPPTTGVQCQKRSGIMSLPPQNGLVSTESRVKSSLISSNFRMMGPTTSDVNDDSTRIASLPSPPPLEAANSDMRSIGSYTTDNSKSPNNNYSLSAGSLGKGIKNDDSRPRSKRITVWLAGNTRKAKNMIVGAYNKMESRSLDTNSPRRVFGASLSSVPKVPCTNGMSVPSPLYRCIEYLEARKAIKSEGLYRLSGSSVTIQSLKDKFDHCGDYKILESKVYYDIHAVASLLKLYFRELQSPILTQELQKSFLGVLNLPNRQEKIVHLSKLVSALPDENYTVLNCLVSHLIRVVKNSVSNKMNLRNICIVFSPTVGIPAGVLSLMIVEYYTVFKYHPLNNPLQSTSETDSPGNLLSRATTSSIIIGDAKATIINRESSLHLPEMAITSATPVSGSFEEGTGGST